MTFDKEKWRAELEAVEFGVLNSVFATSTSPSVWTKDTLALLERAYAEGRRDASDALEEIHIMAAADGPAEFLATQRRRIGQLAIDALAAARGTP